MHVTDSMTDMKIYLVGGAVRDGLLGLPLGERDWVVVGADEATMRARGFIVADRDFPVFLDPDSGEEYALARREIKRGEGYRGFEVYAGPDVTLEEDLRRRDLTVNAMAQNGRGQLIDPYGGRADLDAGLLRHVSEAFVEDPLRVLRIARFASRFGEQGFHIAHATFGLMRQVVARGGIGHLTAERLWREMRGSMHTTQPWRFFEVLHHCGALHELIPALADAMGSPQVHSEVEDSPPIKALKRVSAASVDASRRLAAVFLACTGSGPEAEGLARSLRADRNTAQLLKRAAAGRASYLAAERGDTDALLELIRIWRGFDADSDLEAPLAVCQAQSADPRVGRLLRQALPAVRAVSVDALRDEGLSGAALGRRIAQARRAAMVSALREADLLI